VGVAVVVDGACYGYSTLGVHPPFRLDLGALESVAVTALVIRTEPAEDR
jgi:hypothetical protein